MSIILVCLQRCKHCISRDCCMVCRRW